MRILSKSGKISENYRQNFAKFCVWSGAKVFESCRSRKMLQNAYLDGKIGVETEENEPSKVFNFFNFHPPPGFNFHRGSLPTFSIRHILIRTADLIEFMNPDYHLLGKQKVEIEENQRLARSHLQKPIR